MTFLMVFLIQQTQNRDSAAMQLKLDELIRAQQGAHNTLVNLEGQSEEEIRRLQGVYAELARQAREPGAQEHLARPTDEAHGQGLEQAPARLVLCDDQGQVLWSAPMAIRRGGPAR